ncbi:hypothetical protein FQN55_008256 [Onygenales sp. PD_40]|nr:hypothetical protein FQN55_008256 [Onygenales sp. PD_40]
MGNHCQAAYKVSQTKLAGPSGGTSEVYFLLGLKINVGAYIFPRTHCALDEGIRGQFGVSPEELDIYAKEVEAKRRAVHSESDSACGGYLSIRVQVPDCNFLNEETTANTITLTQDDEKWENGYEVDDGTNNVAEAEDRVAAEQAANAAAVADEWGNPGGENAAEEVTLRDKLGGYSALNRRQCGKHGRPSWPNGRHLV